jgi:hypothetical protein
LDQPTGRRHVVLLAGSDGKADRQAKRIYDSMKFGAEPTPRAAESLGLRSPLLRRAPAAWDWARMTVASAITARTALAFTAARNELLDLLPLIIPKYFAFQS